MKARIYKLLAIVLAGFGLAGSTYLTVNADVMETKESQRPAQTKPCPTKKKVVTKPKPKPKPKPQPKPTTKVVTKKVVVKEKVPVVKTVVKEVPKIITKERVVERPSQNRAQEQSQQQSVNVEVDQVVPAPAVREVAPRTVAAPAAPKTVAAVEQPAELPVTGAKDALTGAFSITTLAGSIVSYRRSKKELNKVINKK